MKHKNFSRIWRAIAKVLIEPDKDIPPTLSGAIAERLESRTLLSNASPFTPDQVRAAYGLNNPEVQAAKDGINGMSGFNGAGETIAIIDFGNDPGIVQQANALSAKYHLPQFGVNGGPRLTIFNQNGIRGGSRDIAAPVDDAEVALDVEWAHVVAPMANIDIVEADYGTTVIAQDITNYTAAVSAARYLPDVTVISMSASPARAYFNDEVLTTPIGRQVPGGGGITFVQASGDAGGWIAPEDVSNNVLSVGGTILDTDIAGDYNGELAWDAGGGGYSSADGLNEFQIPAMGSLRSGGVGPAGLGNILFQRAVPDVSWLAADGPGTSAGAVVIYDTEFPNGVLTDGSSTSIGGTSLAAPMWAGLIADINTMLWQQFRMPSLWSYDVTGLNGNIPRKNQTQFLLYDIALEHPDAFNNISLGDNGPFVANSNNPLDTNYYPLGYDLISGLGSPNVPKLLADISSTEGTIIHVAPATTGVSAQVSAAGSDWADAYSSIQLAVNVAETYINAGEPVLIEVAQGAYDVTAMDPGNPSDTLTIPNGINLVGGYAGPGTSDPDAPDTGATIISGDGISDHVVTVENAGYSTVLSGLTIEDGNANGTGLGQNLGGGLYVIGGAPQIEDCTFTGDTAATGGGIYDSGGNPTIDDCTFVGNSATDGAGAYFDNSNATITDGTFNGNTATDGGAIEQSGGSVQIYDSTFVGNSSAGGANALYCLGGAAAMIINDTFTQNNSTASGGAAILVDAATAQIANSILWKDSNNDTTGTEILTSGDGTVTASYSDISGGFPVGDIDVDPQFVAAPNLSAIPVNYGDLDLSSTSPCVNAGNNALVPTGLATDAAGNSRIVDGIVDMGAYEFQTTPPTQTDEMGYKAAEAYPATSAGGFVGFAMVPIEPSNPTEDIVAVDRDGAVNLLLGNGDGSFGPPKMVGSIVGYPAASATATVVGVADVNGDGEPDIVVGSQYFNSGGRHYYLNVFYNEGSGSFSTDHSIPLVDGKHDGEGKAVSIAFGKFYDNSQKESILVATDRFVSPDSYSSVDMITMAGSGSGNYASTQLAYSSGGVYSVAAGFLQGSSQHEDAVLGYSSADRVTPTGNLTVLLGNGSGTFSHAVVNTGSHVSSSNISSIVVGDLSAESVHDYQDVVVSNNNTSFSIYSSNGDGSLTPAQTVQTSSSFGALTVANTDPSVNGNADVIVAGLNLNETLGYDAAAVYSGNGDGTVRTNPTPTPFFDGAGNATFVNVADVNGDSNPDILTGAQTGNITVILGNGDGSFQSEQVVPVSPDAEAVAIGNLYGDGHPDVVVAGDDYRLNSDLNVFSGDNDNLGELDSPIQFSGATSGPEAIAIGKFVANSNYQDIVTAGNGVGVALSYGEGNFTLGKDPNGNTDLEYVNTSRNYLQKYNYYTFFYAGHVSSEGVAAGPFVNGDGFDDIVVANTHGVDFIRSNGDGTFDAPIRYSIGYSSAVAAGAFVDSNHNLDIIAATDINGHDGINVLPGNGDGTFGSPTFTSLANYGAPVSMVVGDFNGDGNLDVVVGVEPGTGFNEYGTYGSLVFLAGNGNGTFQAPKLIANSGVDPFCLGAADFNGDGRLDIVTADSTDQTINVLLGNGDGTFEAEQAVAAINFQPRSLAIADMNSDGTPDIVVSGESRLSVILNNPVIYTVKGSDNITISVVNSNTFDVIEGSETVGYRQISSGLTINAGNNNETITVDQTNGSFLPSLAIEGSGNYSLIVKGAGTMTFNPVNSSPLSALTINSGSTVKLAKSQKGATCVVNSLSIAAGCTLDITNNTVDINFGSPVNDPVATVAYDLALGFNGGAWTGASSSHGVILSSTAAARTSNPMESVGYADGNTDPGTAAGPNQIVIKYTLAGDANLDGLVNFQDLVTVVQNFNKAGTDWAHGNFQFGASTNFNDLVTVVQNFNKTTIPDWLTILRTEGDGFSASILHDGDILVVGTTDAGDMVAFELYGDGNQTHAAGTINTSFGTNGVVQININGYAQGNAVVELPGTYDIVIAGSGTDPNDGDEDIALVELTANGQLVSSFGDGGVALSDLIGAGDYASASALTVLENGNMVVAGSDNDGVVLEEFNSNGTLDTSFGDDGVAAAPTLAYLSSAFTVTVLSGGNILVAGGGVEGFLTEYNANGTLDTSFGSGGTVTDTDSRYWQSITVIPDGPILAVGVGGGDIVMAEYNSDGSLNSSFGSGGIVTYAAYDAYYAITLRVVSGSGMIQIGALSSAYGDYLIAAQFNPDGSLDTSYGDDGTYETGVAGDAFALALASNGNILVIGGGRLFVQEFDTATG